MKALIFVISVIMGNYAFAVPASIITQILADSEVRRLVTGASITKIEETATFRCMGCYRVKITQRTPVGQQILTVATSAVGPGRVEVEVLSITK
ncbi:MAG: hypothetical protein ABL927_00130 [Bdellovibrionales bacterium]